MNPMMNYQFRKKPVVIEAFHYTPDNAQNRGVWPNWLLEAMSAPAGDVGSFVTVLAGTKEFAAAIVTLEGPLQVSWGDWIIRGVKGELYPCKPDIFSETYEVAAS